jgi:hypothetical protein
MALAYLTHLPVKFGTHGDYFLGRAQLNPPKSLLVQVWPWIEGWRERLNARAQRKTWAEGGLDDDDTAAEGFLSLLAHLRVVLLQDLAILQPSKCSAPASIYPHIVLIDLPAQQNTLTCRCSRSPYFPTPTGSPLPLPSGREKHAAIYQRMSCCVGPFQSLALHSRL